MWSLFFSEVDSTLECGGVTQCMYSSIFSNYDLMIRWMKDESE